MKTVLKNGNVFYQNKIQKLDVEIDGETISQIGHDLDGENIMHNQKKYVRIFIIVSGV